MPKNVNWQQIVGVGFLGGIGFTMSLFISNLAFTDSSVLDQAKVGILLGSLFSGIAGYILLNRFLPKQLN
jgi:NhaA family Na+:H+ antiporter